MELHDIMVRALAATSTVVQRVGAGQLDRPTPCREWDVRALTNHLLLVVEALELAGHGAPIPDTHWTSTAAAAVPVSARPESALPSSALPSSAFPDSARVFQGAASAWDAPEAWTRPVPMGGMPMPADMAVAMLVSDVVIHGWDLARATGSPSAGSSPAGSPASSFAVDDDVAAMTLRFMTTMSEQGRAMGIFAAAVPAAGDASDLDRALALSGRDPSS
ncbi:TIGR03086 family protein [Actinoplanes bogorensis]|uniref:TIGR03086 family protein n=1 Tax=Paractinoplanes bogorensis TaxID=1610840 RepID=A0ABS5YMI0_9ACTN|nr:TIGR03086 family metal-binding protein [Actinoplanes bogorensis]MBU2664674.1 TIGR03086 family protein [Actinoplanes bogorensis]